MKIFISWSGLQSKAFAEILREWIPLVIQAVKPYFSPDDIGKGARWGLEIAKELEESQVGLICLTPENREAPWLLFEAGSLAKNLASSRVCPLLFGLRQSDVSPPLAQFQMAEFTEPDMRRTMQMINEALTDQRLKDSTLAAAFDKWWPDLDQRVASVMSTHEPGQSTARPDREILEEVLQLVRAYSRSQLLSRAYHDAGRDAADFLHRLDPLVAELEKLDDHFPLYDPVRYVRLPLRKLLRDLGISPSGAGGLDSYFDSIDERLRQLVIRLGRNRPSASGRPE